MKKRIFSLFLAFAMILSLLPVSAAAEELGVGKAIGSGGITWSVEITKKDDYGDLYYALTIGGSGPMDDYIFDENTYRYNTPWANYAYYVTKIVISDGVTSIGANAFGGMYNLEKVTIGKDVASISEEVFDDCSSLTTIEVSAENTAYCVQDNVLFNKDKSKLIQYAVGSARTSYTVPNTVKVIGSSAFKEAYKLTSVSLPEGLQAIGDYAFQYDYGITAVTIPDTVTEIGEKAFYNTGLIAVTIPDSVTTVGAQAFSDIYNLEKVHIGRGLTAMAKNAFLYCGSIAELTVDADNAAYCAEDGVLFDKEKTELILYLSTKEEDAYVIPDGVRRICDYAFYDCSKLTSVTFPVGLKTISDYAFEYCSGLTSVVLPEGLETLGTGAFYYCRNLAQVSLPDSLTGVGNDAFYYTGLTSVTIPNGVKTIGESAFTYAPLTDVTIGSGVTRIESRAFSGCTSLTTVTFMGNAPEVGEYPFSSVKATCYYPQNNNTWTAAAMEKFDNANLVWEMISYEVASGTCGDGVSWVLTDNGVLTVSGTGAMAFDSSPWQSYSNQIRKVVVKDGVTDIEEEAFAYYLNLTEVVLADTVVTIGKGAFRCCVSLKELDLGSGVTSIGREAFLECVSLERVVIPNDGTGFGSLAFGYCNSLTEIYILGDAGASDDHPMDVFANVSATVYYTSPSWDTLSGTFEGDLYWNKLTAFGTCGDHVFWRLGDGVLTIFGAGKMNHYSGWSTSERAPWSAYAAQITLACVEEGVTSVGASSFYNCSALTTVYLADSVTLIGAYAFRNCYVLKNLTIPDNVTTIGTYAFQNCYVLTNVAIPVGVTTIGERVFQNCDALTALSIPEKVGNIGDYAFANCDKLTEIEFLGDAPSIGYYAFYKVKATVSYPAGNDTWTDSVKQNYGGTLTWTAVDMGGGEEADEEAPVVTELAAEDEVCTGAFTTITVEATDNVGVDRIVLTYAPQGGETVNLATVTGSGGSVKWVVTGLSDGVYTVTAVAYDAAGNESRSAAITVTVDNVKPVLTALRAVNADGGTLFGGKYSKIFLSVSGTGLSGSDTVTVSYPTLDDGMEYTANLQFAAGETCELDISGWESGPYTLSAAVCDAEGNADALDTGVNITVDNTPPAAASNLYAEAGELKNILSWNKSTEANTTHCVYRARSVDGQRELLSVVNNNDVNQSYVDTAVAAGETWYYWVTARDALGNESAAIASGAVIVRADSELPGVSAIAPVNKSTLSGTASITVTAQDNIGVRSVALECSSDGKNWTEIDTVEATVAWFSVDTTQYPDGTLHLRITVEDTSGNVYQDGTIYSYTIDNTPPEQVTGLTAQATSTVVTLNWDNVGAQDFAHFVVEQKQSDGSYRQIRTVSDALGVYVTGLTPGTAYSFRVYAADKYGNKGAASEPLTVSTAADTTAPVITNIRPNPGRYNGDTVIPLTFTVADDYGVGSLSVQTSYNGTKWTETAVVTVNRAGTSVPVSYNLSTAGFAEGILYVRAVAADLYGNVGDSSDSAPYTQYHIDRTAPAAPTGLTATAGQGYVSLTWAQGGEDDLYTYSVYRATGENGEFTLLSSGLRQIYLVDTGVSVGTTYSYYIDVTDLVGNRSAASEIVSAAPLADNTAPRIVSVSPSDGYVMGPTTAIQVKLSDNQKVAELYYQISTDGGENWTNTASIAVNAAEKVVSLPLVQTDLTCGGFKVKLWCADAAGNTSDGVERSYGLDLTAPHAPAITATAGNMSIQLSWLGGSEADLSGYRVYRAENGGDYKLLFQRGGGQGSYSQTDSNVSVNSTYSYYIEAVDTRGNTAAGASCDPVAPINKDESAPIAVLDGTVSGATGYEISFNAGRSVDNVGVTAYRWDFGDGTTANTAAVNHAFTKAGTYTVTVTVYDEAGNSDSDSMTVTVRDPEQVGSLAIQVRDESGQVVPNAGVYMDLGGENQSLLYTNSMGTITLRPTAGIHVIGVYTDGYLPAKTTVNVVAGRSESVTVNVVKKDIVVGELTVERMTLEQIKVAGINVSNPANQFVYEFNIKLTYGTYEAYISAQYNGEGQVLKNPKPVEIIDSNGETRYLTVNVVPVRGGGTGSGPSGGTGGSAPKEQEVPMVVIMDIPGKASWLKDFFDVRLTVINQAEDEFVLDDCLAYLNVPAGLTLMETVYTKAEASYSMGSIAGGMAQTAHWVLRGDKGGEYDLTADFSAVLREFGTRISAQFQTDEPFRVRQGDGLTLDVVVENAILADTDGAIKVGLRNDDEFPYYLPDLALDPKLVNLVSTYKTNGRVKVNTDRDTLNTGETIWWEYIVPRENWEVLTTYSDQDFYLMEAIVETIGGNAELPYTIQEVMPFSINGDRIVVTRVSSGGGESAVSYLNVDKENPVTAVIPDLMIRTYRKDDTGEYQPVSMEITIKDGYIIDKGEDADGNTVGKNGITVTTNSKGEYKYKGYSMLMLANDKSFNIRVSASRAKPVDIPVVIRGETAETGMLTVYTYAGSGYWTEVLEGATVTLREVNGIGTDDVADTTDEDGKAKFKKVPQGKQELLIEKDGYLPLTAVVDVGSDTEVSYRLYADDDPNASRIIQISNDLTGWGSGNQTIFPEGRVDGTVKFELTRRVAQGETFVCYHYRITDKKGARVDSGTFESDSGFWLELKDLKAGYQLKFAVETDKGVSSFVDSNLIVTEDPGFFGDLVYNLTQIQMGGRVDFTKGLEYDPSTFIKDFSVANIVSGVAVKDDEKGYQAAAIEQTNVYSFTKEESKRIYPLSAKYDLSGKLTLSIIVGGEKESVTTTGGSHSTAAYVSTPNYVAYQGTVAVADEKESDKKKVSGQFQVDFVYQYDPARDDWSLAVYGKISAEQSFTLLEATFLKVGYVSSELNFEESATLEVARTKVGPDEKVEILGNGLIPKEMKGSGELKTAVGAKALSKKVASVGAYLKVGLEFQLLPYLALRANAALGAEGSVLIWSKSKDLISETWEFSGDAEPAAMAAFALYDLRCNPVDTLSLASAPAQTWRMVPNAWIAGAYEQAKPRLVTLNDGTVLAVWCGYTDDVNGPVALYWSVYENEVWSDPARVEADGTADLYPSLIVTDERVQLVWVDFTGSVAEMDNLTYAEIEEQAFTMLGVTTACFTGSGWTVTDAYKGGMLAASPKAAVGSDGSVLVSWIANAGNLEEADADHPDSVSWVLLDKTGAAVNRGSLAAPAVTVAELGVGYDDENGYQLAVLADDGEGMFKLYHAQMKDGVWSNLTAASGIDSADSAMAMAADGTVYTINSGRIYAYADGVYRHVLRSDLLGEDAGELTCVETAQGTVLLWTTTLGTDSTVCMVQLDADAAAAQPVVVDRTADGVFSAPTAAAAASELTVMYQRASAADGIWNHDVLTRNFVMGADLSLEYSLIEHSGYVVPGAYLESYVEVDNLGVVLPDSYAVEVFYVDGTGAETVIGQETGNSSMNLTLKWTVPETYAGEAMYFRVVSEGDSNPANDAVQLGNLIRELALSNPVYVGLLDGKDVFTIDVENQGLVTSETTTLTVRLIGGDDALYTVTVDGLEPGAKQTIRLELTGLDRSGELPLVFAAAPLTGEGDLSNNNEYLILPAIQAAASVETENGTVYYDYLFEALAMARNGDTVRLMSDVPDEAGLYVAPGVTLDLNGKMLGVNYLAAFAGSHVVDNSAEKTGLLKAGKTAVMLSADNSQLPVWNGVDGYAFTSITFNQQVEDVRKNETTIRFKPNEDAFVTNLITAATADEQISVVVTLSWGKNVQTYTYDPSVAARVFAGGTLTLKVTGIENISDLKIQAKVISKTGVETAGKIMDAKIAGEQN